ncbi:MAG: TldD/PmbA family protein [Pseudorhodoplanes sp.]|nr:Metalloprotease PmbA [Pseudorhodoplanes sp.]MBW7948014.1 TldD/PmbA family protein [Pseudorhodoplanes sp.]MCL4712104.1 TldD/PmbA family protein [Pseudorhodoplanes sp.]MCQ3942440.1 TldD/PmbA family protein [Alphaproteobacteria bacterium]GIK81649.1 MAG: modulator protein [Alphaproteobacteria bacterium]
MTSLLDQSALTDLAENLVRAARTAGADAADAVAVRSVSFSVQVREGEVEESERSEGDDIGLRVFVGKRQAVVSTNDIAGSRPAALAERAVAMARIAPEDPYAGLADAALLSHTHPDLDLVDPEIPSLTDLETVARTAESAALAVNGVTKSGGASASAGIGGMVLVTSHGFKGAYLGSRHGVSMMAIAGEGTHMERDYEFSSALHRRDLEPADQVGRLAGERTVKRLNPRKVATQKVPVIFDPRVAGSLIGHLASAANGASVARKSSFLRERMGERLFARGIRIVDDPLRKRGLRSHPFDGEGVGGRTMAIVDDGILKSWFLDSATARELGLATTGHAQRGVSSSPSPGPSNLHLEPGPLTPQALIAETGSGLYVADLIGMGVNLVTGDYSRGAAGFWIENGEIAYPVSEVTIAGHLNDIFRTLTPASDLTFRYGTNAPTLRVEGLTIAGQ